MSSSPDVVQPLDEETTLERHNQDVVQRGEHTAFNNINNDTRQTSIDILA